MKTPFKTAIIFILFFLTIGNTFSSDEKPIKIVIVVPANSGIKSLSIQELQKIFKGQSLQKYNSIQILEFATVSDAFYRSLYGLSTYAIGKHWLRLIFSGERVKPPKSFSSIDNFLEILSKDKNSIGFISAEMYNELNHKTIRAVAINGKHFQQPDYPL